MKKEKVWRFRMMLGGVRRSYTMPASSLAEARAKVRRQTQKAMIRAILGS